MAGSRASNNSLTSPLCLRGYLLRRFTLHLNSKMLFGDHALIVRCKHLLQLIVPMTRALKRLRDPETTHNEFGKRFQRTWFSGCNWPMAQSLIKLSLLVTRLICTFF